MTAYMLRLVKVSEKIVYFYSITKGWEANNQTNKHFVRDFKSCKQRKSLTLILEFCFVLTGSSSA